MIFRTSISILLLIVLSGCGLGFRYVHPVYPTGDEEAERAAVEACLSKIDNLTKVEAAGTELIPQITIFYSPYGPITKIDDGCDADCVQARKRIKILIHKCMEEKGWIYTAKKSYSEAASDLLKDEE